MCCGAQWASQPQALPRGLSPAGFRTYGDLGHVGGWLLAAPLATGQGQFQARARWPALGPSSSTVLAVLMVKLLTLSGKDGSRAGALSSDLQEPRRPWRPPGQHPVTFTPLAGGENPYNWGTMGRRQNGCLQDQETGERLLVRLVPPVFPPLECGRNQSVTGPLQSLL